MKLRLKSAVLACTFLLCSSASNALQQEQTPGADSASPDSSQSAPPASNASQQQSAPGAEQHSPNSDQTSPGTTETSPNPEASPAAPQSAPAENTPVPASPSATKQKATPAPKPPVLHHTKRKTRKPAQAKTSGSPGKVVVKNGGAKEQAAQLTPSLSPEQAKQQRVSTDELLAATDANLQRASARALTAEQKGTVDQIHTYVRQAKAATATGDMNRAQTLAYKARQLSDELTRK
ncbi:MAG TPA: hypothetical protein VJ731_03795 [Terriglobales bacterium]|jgi:outer membrane biosynthesis protein TonB|nr:hypothetical protein [Terriglobales bacterium]